MGELAELCWVRLVSRVEIGRLDSVSWFGEVVLEKLGWLSWFG